VSRPAADRRVASGRAAGRAGRAAPEPCPHAPRCVPCPFRGLPYGEQLRRKARALAEALAAFPSLGTVEIEPIVGSRDLFGYRNVAKLAVRGRSRGGLRAGVYLPGTHRLVDAVGCAVHHPVLNDVLAETLRTAREAGVAPYDELRHEGELRFVVARYSTLLRKVLVVLVTRTRQVEGLRELARRLAGRCRAVAGIVQNVNPDRGNVILGREWVTLRAPRTLVERIGDLRLQASPGAFFQANLWVAKKIYEALVEWTAPQPQDRVIDRVGSEVERIDIVSMNPPRGGVPAELLRAIASLQPRRIAYVSCNPATLARDLAVLGDLGWHTRRIRPFDMLPQTPHVEALALVERDQPPCDR
jgi:23S rRNA (uracil1939-C5)-methyltransferase